MDTLAWMDAALQKAEESLREGEVPVGCLFVYNNEAIATGNNTVNETCNATRHAEINCIDQVLRFCKEKQLEHETVFRNLDVIVTVEPCIMCVSALLQLRVRSIVYGCANDRFGGCTSVLEVPNFYDPKITIQGNVKADEAMKLLKNFYKGTNPNAPESKVKKGRKSKGILLTDNN
ncbi:tRNA-specific adenosine deaminase 2 [Harpegnathos saltator]|uniref:tRNA-specific adenosine deaminase 2 n=1 Tax=Harpegnathos saltator TaxID=610380 RepID=E2BD38_HARSA|nr:tRNA-specific adenosine deaminase 2 [Harpegnathos saltator]EFN86380.1 tRNA-specific adenosine deaminase 2 [Harpegnathos saltator]